MPKINSVLDSIQKNREEIKLQELIEAQRRREVSNDFISIRLNKTTIVLIPKKKAKKEYIKQLKESFNGKTY